MKRLVALLLCAVLCLTMVPFAFATGDQYMNSGDANIPKLSKEEIIELLEDSSLYDVDQFDIFATDPDYTAEEIGEVEEEFLDILLARLNAMRKIAGVAPVTMTDSANQTAQQAAVLIAANETYNVGDLKQPEDMSDSFYKAARTACDSCNLTRQILFMVENDSPTYFINYLMEEHPNPEYVHRRRRMLSPTMTQTGFGLALDEFEERFYFAEYYNNAAHSTNYNFIAWPSSGNFPVGRWTFNRPNMQTAFDAADPWSVTLNPNRYTVPNAGSVSVKLTQESDGRVWNFSSVGQANSFWVNTDSYGEGAAIIFRPWDLDVLDGLYTVEISGIRTKEGQATTIRYQVDCFEPATYQVTSAKAAAAKTAPYFTDVATNYWAYDSIQLVHQENVMNGVDSTGKVFNTDKAISLGEMIAVLVRMYYPDEMVAVDPSQPWYQSYQQAALVHGLIDQLNNVSDWTRTMTRGEIAIMLYNVMSDHHISFPTVEAKEAIFDTFNDIYYGDANDPSAGATYEDHGIGAAVAYGIMNGVGEAFLPNETFTRAQLAALCCNLMYCLPFDPEFAPAPSNPTPAEPTTTPEPTPTPAESEAPVESTAPAESTAPEESTAPAESTAPEESTAPTESAAPEESTAPAPAENAKVTELAATIDAAGAPLTRAIDAETVKGTATISHKEDKLVFEFALSNTDGNNTTITMEYDIKAQSDTIPVTIVMPPQSIAGLTDDLFGKITADVDIPTFSEDTILAFKSETNFYTFMPEDTIPQENKAEFEDLVSQLNTNMQNVSNAALQASLLSWDILLTEQANMDISDIGFTSYGA